MKYFISYDVDFFPPFRMVDLTLRNCASIPGRIMMTDTKVPNSRKKENTSRVTVELLEEGQQPHRRHGAEPQRQEAYGQNKLNNKQTKNICRRGSGLSTNLS